MPKGIPLEPGQRRSPSTSRTTRSSTRAFEGEIPKGEYGAGTVEIWDRGTYELVEEKRDGGLTVRLHGERLKGLWTLVPAKLERRPEELAAPAQARASAEGGARRAAERSTGRCSRTLAERPPPRGEGWLHEVKWDGYRALVLRCAAARSTLVAPERQRPDGALRHGRAGAGARRPHAGLRPRRRGLRARRAGPRELLGHAAGQGRDAARPLRSSTCSRSRASRSSTCRSTERRERLAELLDRRHGTVQLSARRSTTARRCSRWRRRRGSRASSPSAPTRATSPGRRTRRLAEDQDARQRRSSSSPATRRARARARARFGSLVLAEYRRRRRAALRRATSAPASTRRRSSGCSAC